MSGPRIKGSGGVNLLDDPSQIRDDQLTWAKNLIPVKPGVLGTRPALTFVPNNTSGVAPLYSDGGESIIQLVQGLLNTPVIWVARNASDKLTLSLQKVVNGIELRGSSHRPFLVRFNNRVYVFEGPGGAKSGWVLRDNPGSVAAPGTTITAFQYMDIACDALAFAGTSNTNIQPLIAVPYRRRMVYFNLGVGYEQSGLFSDPDSPEIVGDNALANRAFDIGTRADGVITGAAEVMLTAVGSPAQSALLVFTETSAFLLTGEPLNTTESGAAIGDLTVNKVNFNCGCASQATIVTTPHGTIWAGPDNIWLFREGQVPVHIGNNIAPALRHTPPEFRWKWHAVYFDGFYRLAVFAEGQDISTHVSCEQQWWLDLRKGAPASSNEAQWFGPQEFRLSQEGALTDPRPVPLKGTTAMGLIGNDLYVAGYASDINTPLYPGVMNRIQDPPASKDLTVDPTTYTRTDTETGGEIEVDLRSKNWEDDAGLEDAIVEGLDISAQVSQSCLLYSEVQVDGGETVDTTSKEFLVSGLRTGSVVLETTLNEKYAKALIPVSDPANRPVGSQFLSRIYSRAGYYVTSENDTFRFALQSNAEDIIAWLTATMTQGFYASLYDYVTEVVRAMNAAVVTTDLSAIVGFPIPDFAFTHNVANDPTLAPQYVIITESGANTWMWDADSADYPLTAEEDSLNVWASLGFQVIYPTGGGSQSAANAARTATESVPWKLSPTVKLRGIQLNVIPIPRRPS